MFDIGWSELLLIGIVALIVVGPKDLPRMFRTLGQFTGRARNMAREFQRALDSAADESGVKDMAKDLKSSIRGEDMGLDEFRDFSKGPKGWVKDKLKDTPGGQGGQGGQGGEAAGDSTEAMVAASHPAPGPVKRTAASEDAAPGHATETPAEPPADAPRQDAGGSYIPAAARKPAAPAPAPAAVPDRAAAADAPAMPTAPKPGGESA